MLAELLGALAPRFPRQGGQKRPRRAQKKTDHFFYAKVADDYAALCAAGSQTPTRELATLRRITPQDAKRHVFRARSLGYLTQGSQGKRGGTITPSGVAALQAANAGLNEG